MKKRLEVATPYDADPAGAHLYPSIIRLLITTLLFAISLGKSQLA